MKSLPTDINPVAGRSSPKGSTLKDQSFAQSSPTRRLSWLLGEAPGHSIAGFRILFGLYFLGYLLAFAPKLTVAFSSAGMTVPYLIPDWSLPPFGCALVYGLMILFNCALILGYRTRLAAVLLLIFYLYFYLLNIAVKNTSHERLNVILLLLLCFAPAGAVWAVRPSRIDSRGDPQPVAVWVSRLIQLQIAFLYLGAGLWKLFNPAWHDGRLLYYNFIGDWASPVAFWIADHLPGPFVWTSLSWGVILWELAMPIALFTPRFRIYAAISGIFFHLSVWILLGIPEFLNCIAGYVLFFPPETVRTAGGEIFAKLSQFFAKLARD